MSYDDFKNEVLDWNSEIEQENEFVLLPEGEYPFKVTKFERSNYEGSDKIQACKMAVLTLEVGTGSQTATVTERLYLTRKTEWKISQFFISIGQKMHGERIVPNWNAVQGATGRCKIGVRSYNGKTYNNVAAFLEPQAAPKTQYSNF